MSALYQQQQALLERQLQILARLDQGIRYSLARLPDPLRPEDLKNPDVAERIASLNDRCTKLQDQLAGALRHAHGMLGERYRSYADVVDWAVQQDIVSTPQVWMELRALRNRLTHDYDLEAEVTVEIVEAMRNSVENLAGIIRRFTALCVQRGLLPAASAPGSQ